MRDKPKQINTNGIRLLKRFEGYSLVAYDDGGGVPTIGVGHTRGVVWKMRITDAQADGYLADDIKGMEDVVNTLVRVHTTANEFSALVCFVFNVGTENFRKSTLLKLLNDSQYQAVPYQLSRWNKDNGKIIRGLAKRRYVEGLLFKCPDNQPFIVPTDAELDKMFPKAVNV